MSVPLGFHLLPGTTGEDWVRWAAQSAPWVKLADADGIKLAKSLGAKVVYRPYLGGDDGPCPEAHAWAHAVADSIAQTGGVWPDVIEFRNEPPGDQKLGADYVAYRADLRNAGFRGLVALGSFATGTPDFPPAEPPRGGRYDYLLEGLAGAVPDAYAIHTYFDAAKGVDDPDHWEMLRHIRATAGGFLTPGVPIFITETGERNGYRLSMTDAQYAAQLLKYADLLGQPYGGEVSPVQAAFVFADGQN